MSNITEVFLDTEFTHLIDTPMPVPPPIEDDGVDFNPNFDAQNSFYADLMPVETKSAKPELISVGMASESGEEFYAESSDYDVGLCSQFVIDEVFPHIQGGDYSMPNAMMAQKITEYINNFDKPVLLISDAPTFDWPLLKQLFDQYGYPRNLKSHKCEAIFFINDPMSQKFKSKLQAIINEPDFRVHHALDDARANMLAYQGIV